MRFVTTAILISAATAALFLQIEWLFLTMAVFAVVAIIAESSPTRTTSRKLREESAQTTRQNQQVVIIQPSVRAREFYNELITQITTDVIEKKK